VFLYNKNERDSETIAIPLLCQKIPMRNALSAVFSYGITRDAVAKPKAYKQGGVYLFHSDGR
jgi:hypothetical protein